MAWTGTPSTVSGGSIKIGTAEVASGGWTKATISEEETVREDLVGANWPYPKKVQVTKKASGSVEFAIDAAWAGLPAATGDEVTLVLDFDGLYFSGTVRITKFGGDVPTGTQDKLTGSFDWETIDGTYTLDNAST